MDCMNVSALKRFRRGRVLYLILMLPLVLLVFGVAGPAAGAESVQYYQMISTVEYAGKGQFRNQVVNILTVRKQPLPSGEVQYSFTARDPNSNSGQPSAPSSFSFVIDAKTRHVSRASTELAFWARVNNECVKSLQKVTAANVGKTWKESVDLSSLDDAPFDNLSFTLTAIRASTNAFGEMTAVRALSEPFPVKIGKRPLVCKVNTVYLFDPNIEEIFLSISVFEAATDVSGFKETLRHEVATYRTDAAGAPADLSDVGGDFERLVAKVGLKKDSLDVLEESSLPRWARSEGLRSAQVANICSAAVCEGALNPVVTISIPTASVLELQREGTRGGASIFERIGSGFGWNWQTGAIIGGAIAIPIAVSGGGGGSGHAVASP